MNSWIKAYVCSKVVVKQNILKTQREETHVPASLAALPKEYPYLWLMETPVLKIVSLG